jgi:hypothetical protein
LIYANAKLNEVKAKDNVEDIKREMENLSTTMQKIGEEMAKNNQGTQPGSETQSGENPENPNA